MFMKLERPFWKTKNIKIVLSLCYVVLQTALRYLKKWSENWKKLFLKFNTDHFLSEQKIKITLDCARFVPTKHEQRYKFSMTLDALVQVNESYRMQVEQDVAKAKELDGTVSFCWNYVFPLVRNLATSG